MAMLGSAEAGPSKRTKAAPKKKPGSKGHKMTKAKMEAQAVETLDKQAMDYVCYSYYLRLCFIKLNKLYPTRNLPQDCLTLLIYLYQSRRNGA